jgi:uncharacterized protein YceK
VLPGRVCSSGRGIFWLTLISILTTSGCGGVQSTDADQKGPESYGSGNRARITANELERFIYVRIQC